MRRPTPLVTRTLGGVAVLLICLVAATRLRSSNGTAPTPAQPDDVIQPVIGTLERRLLVSGELVATEAVRVAVPRFRERSAVPIQAMVPDGSRVRPGDLLLQLDNATLNTRLSEDLLALDKAENDLARKQAEQQALIKDLGIEAASLQLDKEKAALTAEIPADLMPLREWQDHQFAHEKATREHQRVTRALDLARAAGAEDVERLRIERDKLRARIEVARRDVEHLSVRATTEGTVTYENAPLTWNSGDQARRFQVGDQVSPGVVVMTVADLSALQVRARISEVDGGLVRPGLPARVILEARSDEAVPGRLVAIRQVAERQRQQSNVRVFEGTVVLERSNPAVMKPGMSARVELLLDERQGVLIPRSAIAVDGPRGTVRRPDGATHVVKVVARNEEACLVEGLGTQDRIARTWRQP